MEYVLVLPGAYLLGSISWGLIIGRVRRGIDVREYGSGATGTTNVLRTLGPRVAAVVLVADVSKGAAAVLLARLLIDAPLAHALAGVLVIVGHNWPAFSRFHGGRGVTAAVGALAVMYPAVAAAAVAVFVSTVLVSRYVSLGSVLSVATAMIAIPIMVATGQVPWEYLIYVSASGPIILWRHRGNIQRLLQGTERRIGQATEIQDEESPEGGNE